MGQPSNCAIFSTAPLLKYTSPLYSSSRLSGFSPTGKSDAAVTPSRGAYLRILFLSIFMSRCTMPSHK